MFTASEIFDLAIQVESNGERFYRGALGSTASSELKELLVWLAEHEARHGSEFRQLKDRLLVQPDALDPITGATGPALRSAMGRHAFSLDDVQIHSISDEKEMLRTAIEFEEDTILFYDFIASLITDPPALSTIAQIRAQEVDHKAQLSQKLLEL